jgi:hypothetical protein
LSIDLNHDGGIRSQRRRSLKPRVNIYLDRIKTNPEIVRNILEVIAEAPADGQSLEFTSVESETGSSRFPFRSINNHGVGSCPADSRFGTMDPSQLDSYLSHLGVSRSPFSQNSPFF